MIVAVLIMSMRMTRARRMPLPRIDLMAMPSIRVTLAMRLRVFAENQRLDGHRHRHRRHADAPEVDEVKTPEQDAVNGQHLAAHTRVFTQQVAQAQRDVAIGHHIQRARQRQAAWQRVEQPAHQCLQPPVGRRTAPLQ